jgi:hypothetical protein
LSAHCTPRRLSTLASLLAIVLVAQSSRGPSVVYSYPPAPTALPRSTKPIYSHNNTNNSSGHSSSSSSSSDDGDDDEDESAGGGGAGKSSSLVDDYLGFSKTILASLLSPNRELCDQPFELVVDHLAFCGHPVWLGDEAEELQARQSQMEEDEQRDEDSAERGRSRRRKRDMTGASSGNDSLEVRVDSKGLSRDRDRDSTVVPPPQRTSSEPPSLSRHHSPANPPIALSRSPSVSSTLVPWSSLASSQQSQTSIHGSGRLISFNFVCIIDTPPDSHLSSHLEGYYKDVVVPMTANIKALERRSKWLGKEAGKLRKAREGYAERGKSQCLYF